MWMVEFDSISEKGSDDSCQDHDMYGETKARNNCRPILCMFLYNKISNNKLILGKDNDWSSP